MRWPPGPAFTPTAVIKSATRDRRTSIAGVADPLGAEKDVLELELERALLAFWQGEIGRVNAALTKRAPASVKAATDWDELPKWIQGALDERVWANEDKQIMAVLAEYLNKSGQAGADYQTDRVAALGIGFDPTLVNVEVAEWAREYAGELCRATTLNKQTGRYEFTPDRATINTNTRRAVGARVATWFETPGATLGDLMSEIGQLRAFGPQAPAVPGKQTRAQLVATTETARFV